jgi:LysM repeat protein
MCLALLLYALWVAPALIPNTFRAEAHAPGQAVRRANEEFVVVEKGQTLSVISRLHRVPRNTIAAANRIRDPHWIRAGQRLIIPRGPHPTPGRRGRAIAPAATRTITIKRGDTLASISRTYGVPLDEIITANGLLRPDRIWPGKRLIIPVSGSLRGRRAISPRSLTGLLLWPARGYVSSRFGWRWRRHHNGIDIAANWGSPIRAARDGRVSFARWYRGYGRMIIIDHGGRVRTRYAHASSIKVREGELVRAGQAIGSVGCTGFCLGTHLHFELEVNDRPVDPLTYLN